MRYKGPGRSPWPIVLAVVAIVIVLIIAYWLFFVNAGGRG